MERTVGTFFKCCATCKKWQGKRKCVGTIVHVEMEEKGKCNGGAFNGAQIQNNNTCNKWEKM